MNIERNLNTRVGFAVRFVLCLAMLLCALGASPLHRSQDSTDNTGAPAQDEQTPRERTETRRAEIAGELERVRSQIQAAGEQASPHLGRVEELLARIALRLDEQVVAIQQVEESEQVLDDLQRSLEVLQSSGPSEAPPYSILLLDSVRNELQTLRGRADTITAGLAAATAARDDANATYEQKEAARRRAREAKDGNSDESQAGLLAQALREAQLESRAAGETLELRKLETERQRLLKESYDARVAILEERDTWMSRDSGFTSADLRNKLVELEAKEEQLRERRDLQERRVSIVETQWLETRRRLEASSEDDESLKQEVATRLLAFQVPQRELVILGKRLQRLVDLKELWRRRFEVWQRRADRATLAEWDEDARTRLEALDTEFRLQELELRDLRVDLVALQNQLNAVDSEQPQIGRWLREQIQRTNELSDVYETNIASIDETRRVAERLLADVAAQVSTKSLGERVSEAWKTVVSIWQIEITTVDDRSITIGKIVFGLLLLVLGLAASKLISGWLGRRVLPRLGMNEGASAAIKSILFYVLLVVFVFIALRVINVPLTAFTILGGAVAIGVGFGSQNIMNNFMSGLILIAERPIRVGDLIQIGELYGSVSHIGARSTRIMTGDNIEIVVPNSSFLENNVVNWTLSETKVRIHVNVGVAYGSPTRDVARLMLKAAQDHGRVHTTPKPIVLFTDFGDNSLNFEVHFWITMKRLMDRKQVESDLRFLIEHLFSEAGIVIAFPQRDVHLDASRPIDVRVLREEGNSLDGKNDGTDEAEHART